MPYTIKFTASFGEESKQVEYSYLMGDYYHIYIGRFYYGTISHRQGKWTVLLQNKAAMTMDDIQAIEETIEESRIKL